MYQIKPKGIKPQTLTADNRRGLVRLVYRWQTRNNLKAWDWGSPAVYKDGKLYGYMSWNGKIWSKPIFNLQTEEV